MSFQEFQSSNVTRWNCQIIDFNATYIPKYSNMKLQFLKLWFNLNNAKKLKIYFKNFLLYANTYLPRKSVKTKKKEQLKSKFSKSLSSLWNLDTFITDTWLCCFIYSWFWASLTIGSYNAPNLIRLSNHWF